MGGITVTYTGQFFQVNNYSNWAPASSYVGGVVDSAPPQAYDAVVYNLGSPDTETITFSSPVTNPVIALWSLGEQDVPVVFIFTDSFILEAGGTDGYLGGTSILACTGSSVTAPYTGTGCSATLGTSGTVAYGLEGSGTILFPGTYTSIDFTTPDTEYFNGFTAGYVTPEPETLSLLGLGLLALPLLRASLARRRRA
jgi:hypothetical protein